MKRKLSFLNLERQKIGSAGQKRMAQWKNKTWCREERKLSHRNTQHIELRAHGRQN